MDDGVIKSHLIDEIRRYKKYPREYLAKKPNKQLYGMLSSIRNNHRPDTKLEPVKSNLRLIEKNGETYIKSDSGDLEIYYP